MVICGAHHLVAEEHEADHKRQLGRGKPKAHNGLLENRKRIRHAENEPAPYAHRMVLLAEPDREQQLTE